MLELIFGLLGIFVVPVLLEHSKERGHFKWVGPWLRELWMCVFIFLAFYMLWGTSFGREEMMQLREHWEGNPIVAYVMVGIIGAAIFCGYWWFLGRLDTVAAQNNSQKTGQSNSGTTQTSSSSGKNSPPINANNSTVNVTINEAPPATHPPKQGEKTSDIAEGAFLGAGFRDSTTDADPIEVRIGGLYASNPRGWLRSGKPLRPIVIGPKQITPIIIGMDKKGNILLSCTVVGGDEEHPFSVEIENNVFKVASGFVQKNYNDKALEIATDEGTPLFQIIQENKNLLRINGIFALGPGSEGKLVRAWAWDDHFNTDPERPRDFVLKPIFKYPSWKYLGQYAD